VRFQRHLAGLGTLIRLGAVLTVFWAGTALAGPFVQLQVLLPGEAAAPGQPGGKTGTPHAQVTGVPFPVIVRACDADWNTVGSASDVVRLTSTAGNAVLPAPSVLIGGQVTFEVQLPSVGSSRFTAQDQTNLLIPLGSSANVTAVALAGFRFQDIAAHERQAGSAFVTSLTAIDAGGNVVLGYHGPVQLEQLTSQGLGRVSPGVIMLASGVWSGSLTVFRADESNSQIGSVRVHAHLPGDPGRSGTGDEFVVHPGPFARLQLLVPGMVAVPGSEAGYDGAPASQAATAPFTLTVRATDEYWNPVPSVHQVRVVSSDSWATTPLTLTLAGGTAQGTVALATTGGQTLTAYDIDEPAVQSMVIPPIAVTAAAASHFQFSTLPAGITAGQPIAVTIRAVDAGGSIIPTFNGNARLFASTGPGTISPETATFSEGVWTGQLTFFGAGDDVVVTCVDYATPPHLGPAAAVDVTPAAWSGLQVLLPGESALPGTEAGVVGDPQRQDAGEPFTVTVRAIDDFFNVVPTVNGALELTGTDPRLGVVPAALADGTAAVTVTPYLAGTQTITASALTAPYLDDDTSAALEIIAGPYEKLLLVLPGQSPQPGAPEGRIGNAGDQSITYGFPAVVLATDAWYNPLTGVSDLVSLDCSDPAAVVDGPLAMNAGQATFNVRLGTGGYHLLSASNLTQPAMGPSSTQVRAISSGLHLVATIAQSAIQAGAPFTLEVAALNDAGSVIQELNAQVTVTVRGAQDQAPGRGVLSTTTFQLLQGQRTVNLTYTFAEDIVLHLGDDAGSTPAVTGALRVIPGDPAVITLEGEPHWVRPGRTVDLVARVTDAWGNGIPQQSVTFAVAHGDSGALAPGLGKAVSVATGETGTATAQYVAPDFAQEFTVSAGTGALSAGWEIVTAEVNPEAEPGYLTSYPNPFHPGDGPTTIAWKLDAASETRLRIYTTSGGLVLDRRLAPGEAGGTDGNYEFTWDGTNGDGVPVASGGYVLRIDAQGNGATEHVMRRKIGVVR
jgi:hypothetical protein